MTSHSSGQSARGVRLTTSPAIGAQRPVETPPTAQPRRPSPRVLALVLGLALLAIAVVIFFYWHAQPTTPGSQRSSHDAVRVSGVRAVTRTLTSPARDRGTRPGSLHVRDAPCGDTAAPVAAPSALFTV